jgi:hypothetical protein
LPPRAVSESAANGNQAMASRVQAVQPADSTPELGLFGRWAKAELVNALRRDRPPAIRRFKYLHPSMAIKPG